MANSNFTIVIQLIERLVFYSFLSVIVLFLLSPEGSNQDEAINSYGYFLNVVYFSPLLMGLLSDLINRKYIFVLGFLLISISLFLMFFEFIAFGYTNFLLVIMGIGFATVRPNIVADLFDSFEGKSNSRKIFYVILFFGLVHISVFISPILNKIIVTDGNYNSLFLTLAVISIVISILLTFKDKIINSNETFSKSIRNSNSKIIITLLVYILFSSFGKYFTNQSLSSKLTDYPAFSSLEFIVWIILLVILIKLKIEDINSFTKKSLLFLSIFLSLKFLFVSLFINSIQQDSLILLAIEFLQIIPTIILTPLIYLVFYYNYSSKYLVTGLALLYTVSIIPFQINTFLRIESKYIADVISIVSGLAVLILGIVIYKSSNLISRE